MVNSMYNSRGHITKNEARVLYELLKDTNNNFLDDLINELDFNENEFIENQNIIIKKDYDIFDFNNTLILELYDAIYNKSNINLHKDTGKIELDVSPIVVFYKDETETWYLEYFKKRNYHVIKLDSIQEITSSNGIYKGYKNTESGWKLNSTSSQAKLRIYNERGILRNFIRDLVGKKVKEIEHKENYTDITVIIEDINILKAIVRKHTPAILVLEPESIRNELIKEANEVLLNYK